MYGLIVFISGFIVMVLELAGVRVISPFLGSTHIVYTSIIGIIMASLSVGYCLGGKYSKKDASSSKLAYIIFLVALYILFLAFNQFSFLRYFSQIEISLLIKTILISIIMFAFPSILLGMVSPYTIQLAVNNLNNSLNTGEVVGKYYALSTIGSILGTFLSGFYLIITFGINTIFFVVSLILFILSLIIFIFDKKKINKIPFIIFCLLFSIFSLNSIIYFNKHQMKIKEIHNSTQLLHKTTFYNVVGVFETELNGEIFRFLDNFHSAIKKNSLPNYLIFEYIDCFYKFYLKKEKKDNILIFGNAIGSFLSAILYDAQINKFDNLQIDIVEIDKELTKIGINYFNLPQNDKKINYFYEDARTFLNRKQNKKYDLVYFDIYNDANLIFPFYLITVESFQKMSSLIEEDGIFVLNIIASLDEKSKNNAYLRQIYTQIKSAFPYVSIYKVNKSDIPKERLFNYIICGYKTKDDKNIEKIQEDFSKFEVKNIKKTDEIYTDQYAPIEKFL